MSFKDGLLSVGLGVEFDARLSLHRVLSQDRYLLMWHCELKNASVDKTSSVSEIQKLISDTIECADGELLVAIAIER